MGRRTAQGKQDVQNVTGSRGLFPGEFFQFAPYLGGIFSTNEEVCAFVGGVQLISRCAQLIEVRVETRGKDKIWRPTDRLEENLFLSKMCPGFTWPEWIGFMTQRALRTGNSLARVVRNSRGTITGIVPVKDGLTLQARYRDGNLEYVDHEGNVFGENQIVHFRGTTERRVDGVFAKSVCEIAPQSFRMATNVNSFGAKFFDNTAIPSMVVSYPHAMSAETKAELMEYVSRSVGGVNNHKPFVVTEGGEVSVPHLDAQKMQLLDLRRFSALELAFLLGIPAPLLGLGDTTVWGTGISSLIQAFVKTSLLPRFDSWAVELGDKLFPSEPNVRISFDYLKLTQAEIDVLFSCVKGAEEFMGRNERRKFVGLQPDQNVGE